MKGQVPGPADTSTVIRAAGLGRIEEAAAIHFAILTAAVVAIACLARTGAAMLYADLNPATAHLWEYGQIAVGSVKRGAIVYEFIRPDGSSLVFPTAIVPPLPIFLWMALFWLFGISKLALASMITINIASGTAMVYYTIRIARTLLGSSALAIAAGAALALDPAFVFSATTYHAVNLYGILLLVLFDLCSTRHRPSASRAWVIGLVLGAAILTRTEYIVLGGVILLGELRATRRPKLFALSILVSLAMVAPWTARNYIVFGRFIPVADSFGYNLFKGFNPLANGSGHWTDEHDIAEKLLGEAVANVPVTSHYETDVDTVYRNYAVQFILQHPLKAAIILPLKKILLFWTFDVYDPTARQVLYQLRLWPLMILSVLGITWTLRSALRRQPDHYTVALLFAAQTLVMAAYAVHSRYRLNIDPFLFVYAALGATAVLAAVRSRASADTVPAGRLAQAGQTPKG